MRVLWYFWHKIFSSYCCRKGWVSERHACLLNNMNKIVSSEKFTFHSAAILCDEQDSACCAWAGLSAESPHLSLHNTIETKIYIWTTELKGVCQCPAAWMHPDSISRHHPDMCLLLLLYFFFFMSSFLEGQMFRRRQDGLAATEEEVVVEDKGKLQLWLEERTGENK